MMGRMFVWATRNAMLRKIVWRTWYNFWTRKYVRVGGWEFLNYGYSPTDPDAPALELEEDDENYRFFIQLYDQLVSRIDLRGKELVEVGSGLGGGCSYVHRYLQPAKITGIDYAKSSVAYCQKRHQLPGLTFRLGDALDLPLEHESVDVVLNVESSHSYQSRQKFFQEVHRVLRPGGHFLLTDFMMEHEREEVEAALLGTGLVLLEKQEITAEVLKALGEHEDFKREAISAVMLPGFKGMFREFAGTEGSEILEEFETRYIVYFRFVLQRSSD
jgi:ubiquinone/menaquinone biosynthesis C-methylase UbiE